MSRRLAPRLATLALTLSLVLSPLAAAADPAERALLFERLAIAQSAAQAQAAETEIWRFWYQGPTPEATAELATARALIGARAFGAAEDRLGELIAAHPTWAEPYNQRAILYFITEAYDASLADISRVLAREPEHFGAISGSAQIHFAAGRLNAARAAMARAIAIHPWIGGRVPDPNELRRDL